MEERDVIVVGSGPAGSSCAKALRDEGIDVLVLEKEVLPRYKCCSGVLFGQTQALVRRYFQAETPASIHCSPEVIEARNVREWGAEYGYRRYPLEIAKDGRCFSERYVNVWRNLFDKWLLELSAAECRDQSNVRGFGEIADYVRVRVDESSENGQESVRGYRCKYLVGADGGNSIVRRLLTPQSLGVGNGIAVETLQSYFKLESLGLLNRDAWTVFFLPEVGEMLNCVHQKDEYLVLSVGGLAGRELKASMARLRCFLAEQFDVRLGDWWRNEGCQMQIAPPYLGRGRVLLAGEAANFVYLNGEGISAAIDSGYRCGKAIAQSFREGKSALPRYAENSMDIVAHVTKCLSQARFLASQVA
ncbi:NAD(P)/FAD-dependent oxidoreductase [Aromatoleum bremense]|uniref:NAD(P)-binding protein n=1 Tax=Aromatoleum bremense TaxID=76115 RepID=A0ABX1P0K7_9RHOO|nr:NAD(P)/FAD-dependent oxidoreductase [Aromatoleum bremense]NMG17177.1 NAD(P)-binding protein [Aromatoleum bremense]QTQ30006.1 FAD/NAD(P)-binding domain-containing protein [Aromatoleum bremense]